MKHSLKLFALLIVVLISACSTDFEINAPRDETPVVFGLLEASADTQFIKINKTFLGEGNILDYAQVKDSSEYSSKLRAFLVRSSENDTIYLDTLTVTDKEEGDFYGGRSTVYYTSEKIAPFANNESTEEYKIVVEAPNKKVYATTTTVGGVVVKNPKYRSQIFVTGRNAPWTYQDRTVQWTTGAGTKLVEVHLVFKYHEFYTSGDSVLKSFKIFLGSKKASSDAGGEILSFKWNTEKFYRELGKLETPSNVVKRVPSNFNNLPSYDPMVYEFTIAGSELVRYIELQQPSTGIVQERPKYTNIANGLGLFSSRYIQKLDPMPLHENSLKALLPVGGTPYTVDLKFSEN